MTDEFGMSEEAWDEAFSWTKLRPFSIMPHPTEENIVICENGEPLFKFHEEVEKELMVMIAIFMQTWMNDYMEMRRTKNG